MLESSSGLAWFSMKKQTRDVARDRGIGETGYAVAVSKTRVARSARHTNVTMPGNGKIGDFNIFVDDDGVAYHVELDLTLFVSTLTSRPYHTR